MDYFIIVVTTVAGLYFHGWLYLRIRRWIDRDLALSLAGSDLHKRAFMLQQLEKARTPEDQPPRFAGLVEKRGAAVHAPRPLEERLRGDKQQSGGVTRDDDQGARRSRVQSVPCKR